MKQKRAHIPGCILESHEHPEIMVKIRVAGHCRRTQLTTVSLLAFVGSACNAVLYGPTAH